MTVEIDELPSGGILRCICGQPIYVMLLALSSDAQCIVWGLFCFPLAVCFSLHYMGERENLLEKNAKNRIWHSDSYTLEIKN